MGNVKRLKQGDVTIAFYYVWDETDKCNTSLLGISFPVDLKNRFIWTSQTGGIYLTSLRSKYFMKLNTMFKLFSERLELFSGFCWPRKLWDVPRVSSWKAFRGNSAPASSRWTPRSTRPWQWPISQRVRPEYCHHLPPAFGHLCCAVSPFVSEATVPAVAADEVLLLEPGNNCS